MSKTLKPCPFCGNDGSGPVEDALHLSCNGFYTDDDCIDHPETWHVQCDKCTAWIGGSTPEDAIASWNRRAIPSVLPDTPPNQDKAP